MAGEIEAWCGQNQIAAHLANRIQLAFEECMGLLLPAIDTPRIQAVCEYAEQADSAIWSIAYAGPRNNVTDAGDNLALVVLKGMSVEISYAWNEAEALPNRLRVSLKKRDTP